MASTTWFTEKQLAALVSEIGALTEVAIAGKDANKEVQFTRAMLDVLTGTVHAVGRASLGAAREHTAALELRIRQLEDSQKRSGNGS